MASDLMLYSVIVCDDIRREDNGKAILIGVFLNDLIVSEIPALIRVCLWFTGAMRGRESKFSVRIEIDANEKKNSKTYEHEVSLNNDQNPTERSEFQVAMLGMPLLIQADGTLNIKVRPKGARSWSSLSRKRIIFKPSST
jgi:hypothetical protein